MSIGLAGVAVTAGGSALNYTPNQDPMLFAYAIAGLVGATLLAYVLDSLQTMIQTNRTNARMGRRTRR